MTSTTKTELTTIVRTHVVSGTVIDVLELATEDVEGFLSQRSFPYTWQITRTPTSLVAWRDSESITYVIKPENIALPKNWRKLPTSDLEQFVGQIDDSTQEWENLADELVIRHEDDNRFREGMGWGLTYSEAI